MRWVLIVMVLMSGCAAKVYPGDGVVIALDIRDDANLRRDFPDDVDAGIATAIAAWNDATKVRFQVGGHGTYVLPVHIGGAVASACQDLVEGCYTWSGEVWVGAFVQTGGGGLDSTLAHELGHAIGLNHVSRGIMAPDNVDFTTLQPDDLAAYAAAWR